MATSGSVDFTVNRDEIIKDALRLIKVIADEEEPEAYQITRAARWLNYLVKHWQAMGIHLWKYADITVFTEANKTNYLLGPTGDRAAIGAVKTELAADAASGATSITVDSVTGIAVNDNIGVVLDDATIFWTTTTALGTSTNYTEDFEDADGLTFDPDEVTVTVVAGKAQIELSDNPSQTFNQDFSSSTGFTFDSDKTEFNAGVVRQKDTTPTDSRLGATYTSVTDASWNKDGSTTGTLNGTPTISGNKLVCTGTQGVYYTATEDGTAAVKFKYTPNYTGGPPANINMITLWNGTNNNNRIALTHSPSGDTFRMTLNDNTATSVIATATTIGAAGVGLVASTEYEIELNWDNSSGVVRLFLDGALYGTLSPGAWTHGTGTTRLYVGASPNIYDRAEADYADVVLFNTVQHTSGYTAGYSLEETIYVTDAVTLPIFSYSGAGSIQTFDAFSTTDTGSPRYTLNGNYWNGSAWVASSDTYATASSESDVNTNIAALTASDTLTVKIIWQAANTPQMNTDDLTVTYTGQDGYVTTNPTVTIDTAITGNIKQWNSFTETATKTGSDEIQYILSDDGGTTYKYHNGTTWTTSDGTYSQSNTATVVNSNIGTFPITTDGMKIRLFLHSDDGTTTPAICELVVNYGLGEVLILADDLTGAASTDNHVYAYTSLTVRPLRIANGRLNLNDESETIMTQLSQDGYDTLSNKTVSGKSTEFFYLPTLDNGTLYVWPVSDSVNDRIILKALIPIEDFDAQANNADFPQEWLLPLVYNLAEILADTYGQAVGEGFQNIKLQASMYRDQAMAFDQEAASLYFTPVDETEDL